MASAEPELPLSPNNSKPTDQDRHTSEADYQELLAPPGWHKKIASRKGSSTPSPRDVYFITPDGEEIKSKRALDKYLKSHPGGPTASDFDWSTGETPTRRSSRLSLKGRPSPESSGSTGKRSKQKIVKDEDEKKASTEEEVQEDVDKAMEVDARTDEGKPTKENVVLPEKEEEKESPQTVEDVVESAAREEEEKEGLQTVEDVVESAVIEEKDKEDPQIVQDVVGSGAIEVNHMDVEDKKAIETSNIVSEEVEESFMDESKEDVVGSAAIEVNHMDVEDKKAIETSNILSEEVEESVVDESKKKEDNVDLKKSEIEEVKEILECKIEDMKEGLENKTGEVKESLENKVVDLKESKKESSETVFQHCPEAPDAPRQVDVSI